VYWRNELLAPIIVFAYNRPVHLAQCIKSLQANAECSESDLTVFVDGPKGSNDKTNVETCIRIAHEISGFRSVKVVARSENLGLARSLRTGIDEVLQNHEKVIVFEDDIFAAKGALRFLNLGLEDYLEIENVASIQLYQYPFNGHLSAPVFLRGADCWGWATWKDRWEKVSFDPEHLLTRLEPIRNDFNLDGSARYFEMLEELGKGRIDSWAICWHASMYLENKVSLYPPIALCKNTGSDGTGTHASDTDYFAVELDDSTEWDFPISTEEDPYYRNMMSNFHRNLRRKAKFNRIKVLLKRFRFSK
jgi:glycosyltransferase involved in cell wall biosynthesis